TTLPSQMLGHVRVASYGACTTEADSRSDIHFEHRTVLNGHQASKPGASSPGAPLRRNQSGFAMPALRSFGGRTHMRSRRRWTSEVQRSVRAGDVDPAGSRRLVAADGFFDRRKEILLPEMREQLESLHLVLHRALHLGKAHLDAGGFERRVEFADGVRGGDVNAGDRLRRKHEPADRRRWGRKVSESG